MVRLGEVVSQFDYLDSLDGMWKDVNKPLATGVVIKNNCNIALSLVQFTLEEGVWEAYPPPSISNSMVAIMIARPKGWPWLGVHGSLYYAGPDFVVCLEFARGLYGRTPRVYGPEMTSLQCKDDGTKIEFVTGSGETYKLSCYGSRQQCFILDSCKSVEVQSTMLIPLTLNKKGKGKYLKALGLGASATIEEITTSFMKKASLYHPSKSMTRTDDEAFLHVLEAYLILTSPDAYYNSPAQLDPQCVLQALMGAGRFVDCFGEFCVLNTLQSPSAVLNKDSDTSSETSSTSGDSRKVERWLQEVDMNVNEEAEVTKYDDSDSVQNIDDPPSPRGDIVRELASVLENKLRRFVENEAKWLEETQLEITFKLEAPGGPDLLKHVGYIYQQFARRRLKRFLGLQAAWEVNKDIFHSLFMSWRTLSTACASHIRKGNNENYSNSLIFMTGCMEAEIVCRDVCESLLQKLKECYTTVLCERMIEGLERLGSLYLAGSSPTTITHQQD